MQYDYRSLYERMITSHCRSRIWLYGSHGRRPSCPGAHFPNTSKRMESWVEEGGHQFPKSVVDISVHSFILNIYIAPLQENYSKVLPTPAQLKRAVLRWEKKCRWQGSRENMKLRREPIPGRGYHHGKCCRKTGLQYENVICILDLLNSLLASLLLWLHVFDSFCISAISWLCWDFLHHGLLCFCLTEELKDRQSTTTFAENMVRGVLQSYGSP